MRSTLHVYLQKRGEKAVVIKLCGCGFANEIRVTMINPKEAVDQPTHSCPARLIKVNHVSLSLCVCLCAVQPLVRCKDVIEFSITQRPERQVVGSNERVDEPFSDDDGSSSSYYANEREGV